MSPEKQAKAEAKAKIEKKMKEGYTSTKPDKDATILRVDVDLDNLPQNLCPNKPIGQVAMPTSVLDDPDSYGQRKHNGHCLILVKGKTTEKVYTRRMEDITTYVKDVPFIKDGLAKLKKGDFVLHEAVFFHNKLGKEIPRFVAQIITQQNALKQVNRYAELTKLGTFNLVPLDALFIDHEFVGDEDYTQRYALLAMKGMAPPQLMFKWKEFLPKAEEANWEGLVIRVLGKRSHISFTMDGKAHKAGSWKYKFKKEGDFFVDEVIMGKSGKHAGFYAKFHLGQYDENGNKIDRGYCGCGTFSHEQLAQMTQDIDSGALKLPFVFQVEYQDIHDESGKLEFAQPQGDVGVRKDKTPEECIAEE
jgi:ATP-dependent DNA ligase